MSALQVWAFRRVHPAGIAASQCPAATLPGAVFARPDGVAAKAAYFVVGGDQDAVKEAE